MVQHLMLDALVCCLGIGEVKNQWAVHLGRHFVAGVGKKLGMMQCWRVRNDIGVGTEEGSDVLTVT